MISDDLYYYARVLTGLGRYEDARVWYNRYHQIQPEDETVLPVIENQVKRAKPIANKDGELQPSSVAKARRRCGPIPDRSRREPRPTQHDRRRRGNA